jgi:predicted nucleic acid-binding protein
MERSRAIADTSFVLALVDKSDPQHDAAVEVYSQIRVILLPQTVLAELAYLIGRALGTKAVRDFFRHLPLSRFILRALTESEIQETVSILDHYPDARVDFVDASVMAIAQAENILSVLTLDRRDFSIVKPTHGEAFDLLP